MADDNQTGPTISIHLRDQRSDLFKRIGRLAERYEPDFFVSGADRDRNDPTLFSVRDAEGRQVCECVDEDTAVLLAAILTAAIPVDCANPRPSVDGDA